MNDKVVSTMTLHVAPRLCDGRRWFADGWVRTEHGRVTGWGAGRPPDTGPVVQHGCLMPPLTDHFGHVTGFHNRTIRGDALQPHQECLRLLTEAGVGTVCDVAGHAEIPPSLAELAEPGWPALCWTGPVLDGVPAGQAATRVVTSPAAAHRAVAASAAAGAIRVYTGAALPSHLLSAVVAAAGEHGLPVIHRPGETDVTTAARLGVDCVTSLPLCAAAPGGSPGAAQAIRNWSDPAARHHGERTLAVLAEHRVGLVPLLHSWRRSALLDEAVAEPRLDRLVPIAPFHQYLLDMRGPGLVFGRRYARSYLGYGHLTGRARTEFDTGWRAIEESLAAAYHLGVRLLAGSGAAGISLVPGFALHDELSWWVHAGIPRDAVLLAATGAVRLARAAPASPAGDATADPWAGGVLGLTRDPDRAPSLAVALAGATFVARRQAAPANQPQPQEAPA